MERIEEKGVAALAEQAVRGLPQNGRGAENMLPSVKAAPVVALADKIIHEAVLQNASDIHIEPMKDRLRVRYRIDGVLRDM